MTAHGNPRGSGRLWGTETMALYGEDLPPRRLAFVATATR